MRILKLGCLAIASLLLGVVQGAAQDSYKMAMSWSFEASHLGYLVAQDEGLYKKAGVDLSVERGFGASDTLRRLISDKIQFGIVDALILIKAKAADPKLDLVMVSNVLQTSPYDAIYIEGRKIKTIEDVQKAKFGDTGGSVAQLFPAFMSTALNKPRSELTYKRVVLDPAIRISALFRGDVDIVASVAFEYPNLEFRAKEADIKIGRFDYAKYGFNPYTYGIVVKRSFAEQHPDQVKAVVKASLEGWAKACADTSLANKVMATHQKDVPPETIAPEVKLGLDAIQSSDTPKHGLGYMNKERWKQTAKDAAEGWNLADKDMPDVDALWTAKYMPAQPVKASCNGKS